MWMKRTLGNVFALVITLLGIALPAQAGSAVMHDHALGGILVEAAWSPATPPGIKTSAVYLSVTNQTNASAVLVSVSSPDFKHAHLHMSSVRDGISTMEAVAQVEIPAGKSAVFKPGGLHVMLMGPKRKLAAGDSFEVSLEFQDGLMVPVSVLVTEPGKPGPAPDIKTHQHDHGSMHMN